MTVLILADRNDHHANTILASIRNRGVDAHIWDTVLFPSAMCVTFYPTNSIGNINIDHTISVKFSEVQSVYWRNFNQPGRMSTAVLEDFHQSKIAASDSESLIESIFNRIKCPWYNGLDAYKLHFRKPETLAIAQDMGLKIPNTIISNSITDIRNFVKEFPNCIFKPVTGGAHARRLLPEHISDDNSDSLKLAPITIQEEIRGTNIRAFVCGNEVYGCEIKSDSLDFRDDKNISIQEFEVPGSIKRLCIDIAKGLHLKWTGIDFRLDQDGDFYFLEANFSPMFLGFEERTKIPLTKKLTDLILGQKS